jgi:hypothetical protein
MIRMPSRMPHRRDAASVTAFQLMMLPSAAAMPPARRCRGKRRCNQILEIDRGAGRQDHRGHHHHRDRPDAGLRRHVGRLPPLIQIVFGLSIAFAASFFLSFFSFGGGALV